VNPKNGLKNTPPLPAYVNPDRLPLKLKATAFAEVSILKIETIALVDLTCNGVVGVFVPIPTFPELDTNTNVLEPDDTVNDPVPVDTDADTLPVEIWDRFKPTIPDAGILFKPAPLP
jgi:hypothetical protein